MKPISLGPVNTCFAPHFRARKREEGASAGHSGSTVKLCNAASALVRANRRDDFTQPSLLAAYIAYSAARLMPRFSGIRYDREWKTQRPSSGPIIDATDCMLRGQHGIGASDAKNGGEWRGKRGWDGVIIDIVLWAYSSIGALSGNRTSVKPKVRKSVILIGYRIPCR